MTCPDVVGEREGVETRLVGAAHDVDGRDGGAGLRDADDQDLIGAISAGGRDVALVKAGREARGSLDLAVALEQRGFKFVPIFLGYVLGSGVITSFVDQIPPVIQDGLNQSGNLLPALGVAMLIQLTWDKKFGVFLFLGFALAAFLNVSTLGAAFFGAITRSVPRVISRKRDRSRLPRTPSTNA